MIENGPFLNGADAIENGAETIEIGAETIENGRRDCQIARHRRAILLIKKLID